MKVFWLLFCLAIIFYLQPPITEAVLTKLDEDHQKDCEGYKRFLLFDAGSSKTILYFYRMKKVNEWEVDASRQIKRFTALSQFNPASFTTMQKEITEALAEAKKVVNPKCVDQVPIYLRATAGLRSLEQTLAHRILEKCRETFMKSIYKFVGDDSAKMFTGQEEGLWLWVFMNYVLNKFINCGHRGKVQGFDMGGGSTQVATLKNNIDYKEEMKDDIIKVNLGCTYEVYSVSYEPAGAMENRKNFFVNHNMKSECMADGVEDDFKFGDFKEKFVGKGHGGPETYGKCKDEAENYAKKLDIAQIWTGKDVPQDMYLVAAFFHIYNTGDAIKKGCKSPKEKGCSQDAFTVAIQDIQEMAKVHCTKLVSDPEIIEKFTLSEYLCIDLVWVETVLKFGYGISNTDVKLNLVRTVGGHQAGWTLGFIYGLSVQSDASR